jgi:hypothetical protein
MTIFYCLKSRTPLQEVHAPVFNSSRNSVAHFCPRALGWLFVSSFEVEVKVISTVSPTIHLGFGHLC